MIQDEDEGSGFLDKIADVVKDGIEEVKEAVEDVIGNDEDEEQVWSQTKFSSVCAVHFLFSVVPDVTLDTVKGALNLRI